MKTDRRQVDTDAGEFVDEWARLIIAYCHLDSLFEEWRGDLKDHGVGAAAMQRAAPDVMTQKNWAVHLASAGPPSLSRRRVMLDRAIAVVTDEHEQPMEPPTSKSWCKYGVDIPPVSLGDDLEALYAR